MSSQPRGEHRGGRGGPRGGGRGGGRGNHEGGRGGHVNAGGERERPKKENILDLGKYMDKQITVKFTGGREGLFSFPKFGRVERRGGEREEKRELMWSGNIIVTGTLKGYDALMNLVLDDVSEVLRGMSSLCISFLI
jgi:small nuclear ribonucleoprotein (snRNP)-like protein